MLFCPILPHSAPSWIFHWTENQVPTCKMEPQRGCIMQRTPSTHPPNRLTWDMEISFFQCCGCPHPNCSLSARRYVSGIPLPVYVFVCCVPPNVIICLCRTRLCLGLFAKLRIRQIPACKMKPQIVVFVCYLAPSSTCIFECGTPSLSLFILFSDFKFNKT